jgi:hypothetical protein
LPSKNLKVEIYRTIILPVVLYGCETWSLILREERKVRVFVHRRLRRIFGLTRDEVTWEWRKLHNVELHYLYSSPTTVRVIKIKNEMGCSCNSDGEIVFVGESCWGNPRERATGETQV